MKKTALVFLSCLYAGHYLQAQTATATYGPVGVAAYNFSVTRPLSMPDGSLLYLKLDANTFSTRAPAIIYPERISPQHEIQGGDVPLIYTPGPVKTKGKRTYMTLGLARLGTRAVIGIAETSEQLAIGAHDPALTVGFLAQDGSYDASSRRTILEARGSEGKANFALTPDPDGKRLALWSMPSYIPGYQNKLYCTILGPALDTLMVRSFPVFAYNELNKPVTLFGKDGTCYLVGLRELRPAQHGVVYWVRPDGTTGQAQIDLGTYSANTVSAAATGQGLHVCGTYTDAPKQQYRNSLPTVGVFSAVVSWADTGQAKASLTPIPEAIRQAYMRPAKAGKVDPFPQLDIEAVHSTPAGGVYMILNETNSYNPNSTTTTASRGSVNYDNMKKNTFSSNPPLVFSFGSNGALLGAALVPATASVYGNDMFNSFRTGLDGEVCQLLILVDKDNQDKYMAGEGERMYDPARALVALYSIDPKGQISSRRLGPAQNQQGQIICLDGLAQGWTSTNLQGISMQPDPSVNNRGLNPYITSFSIGKRQTYGWVSVNLKP